MSSSNNNWEQGPTECCNDVELCCYTYWCACLAYKEAATNVGVSDGESWLYCISTFPLGCGCCALTFLGGVVAEKQGIQEDIVVSAVKSCFDCCLCYSCTVVNESRKCKAQQQGVDAVNEKMERD
mmetsp:Transcript_27753/g.41995  ORF Transcript_27753/g.41995 Transcript_27753/m.41995 type:complete len:125 (+) Transcript_27753:62-436(+)|eukprot:CAMPEP_0178913976 /NCGR_PEP_ID=MMETSP0786-20121207/11150_1 /TAXON_ID=186022 /ORGANISM="Thalassionema frauenfeldii, Strain CCMP 1798" /LENGTH=124 /DNA_ID=CAMNT_0020586795 /DNA_START=45 /DNA_END=419 /DNA_ORIENTATION=-